MKTLDDLLAFTDRLDKSEKAISGFITAINKCLVPVLSDAEMLDVTVLNVMEVTKRDIQGFKGARTLETYRDKARRVLRLFKSHIERGDVPLREGKVKYRESVMRRKVTANLYGNVEVTMSIEEVQMLRALLRRLPEVEPYPVTAWGGQ